MAGTILSAGDYIEARCTKCRCVTNHTIIAMTADVPAKVECNTCQGQHKYRPAVAAKPAARKASAARKSAARTTADPKAAERNEWTARQAEIEAARATDYSMEETFPVGAVIRHPTFGLGLVERNAGEQKIEVLFADGRKILRCR